jgi:hypothetical protein
MPLFFQGGTILCALLLVLIFRDVRVAVLGAIWISLVSMAAIACVLDEDEK